MATTDTFDISLEEGKRGESAIITALRAKGNTIKDVSDDWNYRHAGIDLLVVNKEGQKTTLEVKNDIKSETTGNFFLETFNTNNITKNFKGWYITSETKFICFVQEVSGKAHIVAMDELRQKVKKGKYKMSRSTNAEGILFPLADLQQLESYYYMEL